MVKKPESLSDAAPAPGGEVEKPTGGLGGEVWIVYMPSLLSCAFQPLSEAVARPRMYKSVSMRMMYKARLLVRCLLFDSKCKSRKQRDPLPLPLHLCYATIISQSKEGIFSTLVMHSTEYQNINSTTPQVHPRTPTLLSAELLLEHVLEGVAVLGEPADTLVELLERHLVFE